MVPNKYTFDDSKNMWKSLFSVQQGINFIEYIKYRIELLRTVLEEKDCNDTRAEIRVYRDILSKYNEYSIDK